MNTFLYSSVSCHPDLTLSCPFNSSISSLNYSQQIPQAASTKRKRTPFHHFALNVRKPQNINMEKNQFSRRYYYKAVANSMRRLFKISTQGQMKMLHYSPHSSLRNGPCFDRLQIYEPNQKKKMLLPSLLHTILTMK